PAETDDLFVLFGDRTPGLLYGLWPGRLEILGCLNRRKSALVKLKVGEELWVTAQHDVGAAAGHVGGHGDAALAAGLGHDRGLALVVLSVQHFVRHTLALEHPGDDLGLLHADGADQYRLADLVPLLDVLDEGIELGLLGLVHDVGLVSPDHRHVRRNRHHAELVGLVELVGLGQRGTRHAGELAVEPEVVLQRDRGECLVLVHDLDALFGLDRLVHAVAVAAAVQDAAGEVVDDEYLAAGHHIVFVLFEKFLGLDRVVQEPDQMGVRRVVQVFDAQLVLDKGNTRLQDADGALLLVDLVVAFAILAAPQPRHDLGELGVPDTVLVGWPADDQRRPGLVDQDRVHLIDDREVVTALHALLLPPGHVVPEVVEAELVVGAVGDVGRVMLASLVWFHFREDHADFKTKEPMNSAHPLGVALSEVVVHGDYVHALARQRVEVGGKH